MAILQSVYPHETFIPWMFPKTSSQFWAKRENRLSYVSWLIERTGRPREQLTIRDFYQNHGGGLFAHCGSLKGVWESLESDDFRNFRAKPSGKKYIKPEEERQFFELVRENLGYKEGEMDFWYKITDSDSVRLRLRNVVKRYPSFYHCLVKVYPEHSWEPWRFTRVSSAMIRDPSVINKAIAYAENALKITSPEQWYTVSASELRRLGVDGIFELQRQSLYHFLKKNRPEFDWKETNFAAVAYYGETHLGAYLRDIFPNHEVHSQAAFPNVTLPKPLSYSIPTLRLAFLYQPVGDYGFSEFPGKRNVSLKIDDELTEICQDQGVDLITIPFWWERTLEQLVATILSTRPELFGEMNHSIRGSDIASWTPIPTTTTINLSLWRRRHR